MVRRTLHYNKNAQNGISLIFPDMACFAGALYGHIDKYNIIVYEYPTQTELQGQLERITFRNEENHSTIAKI